MYMFQGSCSRSDKMIYKRKTQKEPPLLADVMLTLAQSSCQFSCDPIMDSWTVCFNVFYDTYVFEDIKE